jgi:hypothetical protein
LKNAFGVPDTKKTEAAKPDAKAKEAEKEDSYDDDFE